MGTHHGLQAFMNWDSMPIRSISSRIAAVGLLTFLRPQSFTDKPPEAFQEQ